MTLQPDQVRDMFDRITPSYDRMNRVMSMGMDGSWRARAVRCAGLEPGSSAIDVCCGTGDLAIELLDTVSTRGRVVGLDFSERMIEAARAKSSQVEWLQGDALDLPFATGEFDACTVGFGVRNLPDIERGFREMARVVRPGGRVVCLELTPPPRLVAPFARLWTDHAVPLLGRARGPRDRRLSLPARVRAPVSARRRAGRDHARRRSRSGAVPAALGRRGRAPRRDGAGMSTVAAVLEVPGVSTYLDAVEERLRETVGRSGGAVSAAGVDTLASGGKRLRPMLVHLCAPPAGRTRSGLVAAGCAVELVHMATLVHDDQIDAAPLRRGRPTVWRSRGPLVSTASGDYLFARAFSELVTTGDMQAVTVLSDACLALARGEILQREQAGNADTTPEQYLERCRLKTGGSSPPPTTLGARLGGLPVDETERMGEFGIALGLAFQIADDVLDCDGDPDTTGKALGTDLLDGTVTLPLLLAARRDPDVESVLRRGAGSGRRAADAGPGRPLRRGGRRPARGRAAGGARHSRRSTGSTAASMSPRSAPWCAARSSGARSEPRGQTPAHFGAWIGAGLRPCYGIDARTHGAGLGRGLAPVVQRVVGRRRGRDGSQPTLSPRPATAAAPTLRCASSGRASSSGSVRRCEACLRIA